MSSSSGNATSFSSSGTATSSSIHLGGAAQTNETPQQKIARLRAAAARARIGTESRADKVVRIGRVWADRAHRTTAWSLIGLTVVCGVFATFAVGDMLIHNRRKRNEWLQDQLHQSAIRLEAAREAAAKGTANEHQMLLLNIERAAEEAEAERKARGGIFAKAKEAMFGGAAKEEEKGGRILAEVRATQAQQQQHKVAQSSTPESFLEDVNAGLEQAKTKVKSAAAATENVLGKASIAAVGGPLDREAQASTDVVTRQTRGWISWVTGR